MFCVCWFPPISNFSLETMVYRPLAFQNAEKCQSNSSRGSHANIGSLNNVQIRCIVKGEAQKSPLFWRFSGGFWFSQDRLLCRNSKRKPLNLVKSPILRTPLVNPLVFTMHLVCTLLSHRRAKPRKIPQTRRIPTEPCGIPLIRQRNKSTKINFLGPETARWGGGLSREGVVAEKFVHSLESLSFLGFEERNLGCPGNFAGVSRTPAGVQKVCAKKKFVPYLRGGSTERRAALIRGLAGVSCFPRNMGNCSILKGGCRGSLKF